MNVIERLSARTSCSNSGSSLMAYAKPVSLYAERRTVGFILAAAVMLMFCGLPAAAAPYATAAPVVPSRVVAAFQHQGFVLLPDIATKLPKGIAQDYGIRRPGSIANLPAHITVFVSPTLARQGAKKTLSRTLRTKNVLLLLYPGLRRSDEMALVRGLSIFGKPVRP